MPILENQSYHPKLLFRNAHINTIYPFLFRRQIEPLYKRTRLTTPDLDFIDLDCIFNQNNTLVILCHGLEGSSNSQYIQSAASLLSKNEYDVIAFNFRSCSGEMNKNVRMYHSGETTDLDFVIKQYADKYRSVHLVGFSLGGNVVLKYVGTHDMHQAVSKIVAVSTPIRLDNGAKEIIKPKNKLYEKKFLKTLTNKIKLKHQLHPDHINIKDLSKIKNLIDFDEYYTSRIHGFDGAFDYYQKSSSRQFIPNIDLPTLIITALDDPFFGEECYPKEEALSKDNIYLLTPKYGGHVGFATINSAYYWSDYMILNFLNESLLN